MGLVFADHYSATEWLKMAELLSSLVALTFLRPFWPVLKAHGPWQFTRHTLLRIVGMTSLISKPIDEMYDRFMSDSLSQHISSFLRPRGFF